MKSFDHNVAVFSNLDVCSDLTAKNINSNDTNCKTARNENPHLFTDLENRDKHRIVVGQDQTNTDLLYKIRQTQNCCTRSDKHRLVVGQDQTNTE